MQTRQLNFAFFPAKDLPNVPLNAEIASRSDSVLLPPSADDDELDETCLAALVAVTFISEGVCAFALGRDMLKRVLICRRSPGRSDCAKERQLCRVGCWYAAVFE